jgi:hypothetical protein
VKADAPVVAELDPPAEGFVAYFADLGYVFEDLPQWLCTQLRLSGAPATATGP